jgi:hypothetical protein
MSQRAIKTLFAWRKGEDSPELLLAWDEYDVDGNYAGWADAKAAALAAMGNDISEFGHRCIDIYVDADKVAEMFYERAIDGEVGLSA